MEKKTLRSDILLILTSAIWGFAFVAQLVGMDHIGPYLYNAIRFALGSLSLMPLILFFGKNRREAYKSSGLNRKGVLIAGIAAGTVLFLGASLQQVGLQYTTAGKAGFITGLYVILVPILGIALSHRTGLPTWIGAFFAAAGLYLISVKGGFQIGRGDLLILACSLFFAIHVLTIDHFSRKIDPLVLSAIQFAVCSFYSFAVAVFREPIILEDILQATIPILYGGLGSVGIAYTLQVVAQKDAPPAHSAIIMSLESVFAVIGGIIFLAEGMSLRGYIGCGLMLLGMLASQWDVIFRNSIKKEKKMQISPQK
ncbi:DMT family transporter [Spirochaeta isovalerica]|uniref:Drug/metabolite transporter (DMT)-like permease n=1 Tax=Spirochaeta isovalerica TaxID=150 RepID=A0A841RC86_9SPIO|nr:DMT family transporter [Spirochaeta isovalerica]MBB6480991.1 drug/metabolite transporter (DMT)-like permease [Spirochaeta isovalerica]